MADKEKKDKKKNKMTSADQNVKMSVEDNVLTIRVNLSKDFGPSGSGKTIVIASTKGNKRIDGTEAVIGLNVYKYPEKD